MKITPNTLTLQQLFLVTNEQFSIPAYQRRYAWGPRQHRELFDDIRLLPDGDSHLFGTVLFLTETHSPGINVLELVDGQQRITTLMLLLRVLAKHFESLSDHESVQDIQKVLRCKGLDGKPSPKLVLGDLDNPDYTQLMEDGDSPEVVNRRLAEAYGGFSEWIGKLDEDQVRLFYFKLMNSSMVIRLDVGQAKDAYKLFETINNRGLRLRPTDIIKNFLLGHASSLGEKTLAKVKDNWRALIVALDELESDDFFRQYLAGVLRRKITASKLVTEFKAHYLRSVKEAEHLTEYKTFFLDEEQDVQGEDPEDDLIANAGGESGVAPNGTTTKIGILEFTKNLRRAADTYGRMRLRKFESAEINRHLRNLERIRCFPAYTFLLPVFQKTLPAGEQVKVLKLIEAFMMRRHICERRTAELETIFATLAGAPSEGIADFVRGALAEYMPPDDEFEDKFAKYTFVSKVIDRARYALEMFEYDLIGHKDEFFLADPSQLHLEHIIPQTIDTKKAKVELGDWTVYLGAEWKKRHAAYVNRIGNMTLLADELNISASNNPFLAKKKRYKDSNIALTKDLVAKYGAFRFKQVEARSAALAKKATQLWKL